MRLGERLHPPLAVILLLLLSSCDKPATATRTESGTGAPLADTEPQSAAAAGDEVSGAVTPFAAAALFLEFNATDKDMGLQLFVDSDGWKRVRVLDPSNKEIVLLEALSKLSQLGITELRFESAEPSPAEVLSRFPAGEYRFRGSGVEGEQLASSVNLSHELVPTPTFSPSGGEIVDPKQAVVEWNAPGAEQVELIIEQDKLRHVLDITVSGSTRRMRIPEQFLTPGQEYKIEILSISGNGNRTIVQGTFRTKS
jgi:hypothetical protein